MHKKLPPPILFRFINKANISACILTFNRKHSSKDAERFFNQQCDSANQRCGFTNQRCSFTELQRGFKNS